jgi:type IV pilus assembly protein PilN
MIKINLLGDDTVRDMSGTWLLIGYVFSLLIVGLVASMLYLSISADVQELTLDRDNLQKDLNRLNEVTKEVATLEAKKKELSDKTSIIALLKRNKIGPVRVLDDVNTALPERAWLEEMRETEGMLRVTGYALDNQTIAQFMKGLEASEYVVKVDLEQARRKPVDQKQLVEFILRTQIAYAGKVLAAKLEEAKNAPVPVATPTPKAKKKAKEKE